jgi:hypothetical protein
MNTTTDIQEKLVTNNGTRGSRAGADRAQAHDIAKLVLRIAGADDGESVEDLAQRAGDGRPLPGALMLGAIDGRVLAAASMSTHEALSEPTPSGAAAFAVLQYTLANLERRGSMPRRAA